MDFQFDTQEIPPRQFYGRRYERLGSAIDAVHSIDGNNPVDIVIIPPEVDEQTDQEDIDDEDIQVLSRPRDVPGTIELHYEPIDEEYSSEDEIPLSRICTEKSAKKRKTVSPVWSSDCDINIAMPSTSGYLDRAHILKAQLEGKNLVEIFEKIVDDNVVQHIVNAPSRLQRK